MFRIITSLVVIICLASCFSTKKNIQNDTFVSNIYYSLDKIKQEKYLRSHPLTEADVVIIMDALYTEGYKTCDCKYGKVDSPLLLINLLVNKAQNLNHIYDYIGDHISMVEKNNMDWYYCVKSLYTDNCTHDYYNHNIESFPWILNKARTKESAYNLVNNLNKYLNQSYTYSCYYLVNTIQANEKWREELFNAAYTLIESYGSDFEFTEEVHYLFDHLPDKLTSQYAINYLKEYGCLTDPLYDLIYDRITGERLASYKRFLGEGISYDEASLNEFVELCTHYQNECEYCTDILYLIQNEKELIGK